MALSNSCSTTTGTGLPSEQKTFTASRQLLSNRFPAKIAFDNGSIEFTTASRSDIKTPYGYTNAFYLNNIIQKNNLQIIKPI